LTRATFITYAKKDGFMAGKPLNRMELRRQSEAAEPLDPMEDETEDSAEETDDEEVQERKPKKKAKAAPKSKAKSSRAAKPAARMRIVWSVLNDAFKTVATFDYAQKEAAEAKAAELTARGKGVHFVQRTKEAMPEDAPGIGAVIPRAELTPAAKVVAQQAEISGLEEDDDDDEEEEEENEPDFGDDDDEE
jgi:hypothetical protein